MKRFYKFLMPLVAIVAMALPWSARAQSVGDCRFSTGVDSTLWVVLTDSTSLVSPGSGDYGASTVQNIGFTFPFAGQNYTQFSVNTDGNLRLGPTATSTDTYTNPFSSANANTNSPKINPMGCDGFLSDSGYICAETVENADGETLLVVEFATSTYTTSSRESLLRWQVHLYESGKIVIVFAGTEPTILPAVSRQCGLCASASDGFFIDANHNATYFTNGTSATIPAGNWPDVNRYYQFVPATCLATGFPVISGIEAHAFTATWPASTAATEYVVRLDGGEFFSVGSDTTYTATDISADQTHFFEVAVVCSAGDTSATRGASFTTPPSCVAPGNPVVSNVTPYGFTISWNPAPAALVHVIRLGDGEPFDANGETTYTFTGLDPETQYTVYVAGVCDDNDTSAWRSATTTTLPSCDVLTNVAVNATVNAAIFSWGHSVSDPECQALVEWRQEGDASWTTAGTATGTTMPISGLTAGTSYEARLAAICSNGDTSAWTNLAFSTGTYACSMIDSTNMTTDTTSNGTATSDYILSYSFYNYSYTQQIYTPDEVGAAGPIISIQAMPSAVSSQRTYEIYLGHVSQTTATAWLNPSDLTLVYSGGQVPMTANTWLTFNLDQPFIYNGTDNLLVVFRDMTGSYTSGNAWKGTNGTSGVSRYVYQDGSAYSVPPTSSGTSSNFRANLVFTKAGCLEYATCANPQVVLDQVGTDNATISWIPGGAESSWDIYMSMDGGAFTQVTTTSNMTYTFTDLLPGTLYEFKVEHQCSGVAYSGTVSTYTDCAPVNFLMQDFEGYPTGSNADFDVCWYKNRYGTSTNYPYISTSYANNSANSMYFYGYWSGSTRYYSWLVTPEMADSLNTYNVEFDMYRSSTTSYYTAKIIVGALSDPNDINTMDSITEFELRNTMDAGRWHHMSCSLAGYHGMGKYIVLLAPAVEPFEGTYSYNDVYMDNLMVESGLCPHPTRLHARNITANGAEVAWDTNSAYNTLKLFWGTTNNIAAATDSVEVTSGNSHMLSGLSANTTYYVWLAATCEEGAAMPSTISFTTASACGPAEGLHIDNLDFTAATFSWNDNSVSPATGYTFAWREVGEQSWNTATPTGNYYMLNGLTEGTTYEVSVTSVCGDENGTPVTLTFTTNATGTIGANEGTYYLPTYPYYNYSISEQLWLANELGAYGDTINGIYFNAASAISARPMKIWVGNTTLTDLSASSNVPSTDMTLVFDSTIDITTGWNHFEFDAPFVRTGNLVVLTLDDAGEYEGFSGWIASNSPVSSLHAHNDGDTYSTTDLSGLTVEAVRAQMRLDATQLPITCFAPHPVVTDATSSSLAIAWLRGGSETSYKVDYRLLGDTVWNSIAAAGTDTFAVVTGLQAASRYQFRVGSICAPDTMYATLVGTTLCGSFTVPYSENFNAMASGDFELNPCWAKGNTGTAAAPSTANITTEGMMLQMPTGSYVVFPEMDEDINTLQLRMRFAVADANIYSVVGVCSYPGDILTFTPIDTVRVEVAGTATWVTIPFDSYTGTTGSIAIYSSYNQSYVDDINIELMPMCKPADSLIVSNIGANSADVSWTAATNATGYLVDYYVFGSNNVVTVPATGTTVTLTGLQHSTSYLVSVRTICSLMNDTSLATNATAFITNCEPVDALPYVQDFDHSNVPSLNYTGMLPNCWNYTMLATGTYAAGNYLPQIYSDNTYAHSGQYSLRLAGSTVVTLPEMPTSVDSLMLSFHEYNTGTSYYGLIVGVCDSSWGNFENSFVPIDTLVFTQSHTDVTLYDLATYTGTGRYIAFRNFYINSTSSYSYHYIDDVVVDYLPSCLPVQNLRSSGNTPTSIDLAWTDLRPSTEWQLSYSTSPLANPTTGTLVSISTNPYTVSGLNDSTTYYFYVRNICGAGDTSIWSNALSCRPGTWVTRANQTDTVTMCGGIIYDDGGANGSYSNSQNSYIIVMPEGNNVVTLSGTLNSESCCDSLVIYDGIGTSGARLWGGKGTGLSFNDVVSTDGPLTIYFHCDGSVNNTGYEIHVGCAPNACPISDIHVDTLASTSTSVRLAWTGSSTGYEIEYGLNGFERGNGTTVTSATNSVTLNNLDAMTSYVAYIRGFCDPDTSRWFRFEFVTAMCDNVSIAENWDSTMTSTTSYYTPLGTSNYNYSYVQIIVDSAQLAAIGGDITGIGFLPTNTTASSYYTNMDVYMANVNESTFTDFILPDATHQFTHVISQSDFSYTTAEWQNHALDSAFHWDGHSNLLVAISRQHGSYLYGALFAAHNHGSSNYKTVYDYQDNEAFDITTVTDGTTSSIVGDIRLYSCSDAACDGPANVIATATETTATVAFVADAGNYEVAIAETWDDATVTPVAITDTFYTFTGLTASTTYTIGVRTVCPSSESEWVLTTVTTDEHPCATPSALTVSDVTLTSATLGWTIGEAETQWELHVTGTNYDETFTVNTNPYTVTGLTPAVTYSFTVSAICSETQTSDPSEAQAFTTASCQPVSGVIVSNVTTNSAQVSWTAVQGVNGYEVEYGASGFNQGAGTTVQASTNNATITGLTANMPYDVYVRSVCGDGFFSAWSSVTSFTTDEQGEGIDDVNSAAIALYPNPATTTVTISGISGQATVTIVDMNGRVNGEWKVENDEITLDLTGYAQGAYFVRITGEQQNAIRKLIVK